MGLKYSTQAATWFVIAYVGGGVNSKACGINDKLGRRLLGKNAYVL